MITMLTPIIEWPHLSCGNKGAAPKACAFDSDEVAMGRCSVAIGVENQHGGNPEGGVGRSERCRHARVVAVEFECSSEGTATTNRAAASDFGETADTGGHGRARRTHNKWILI